VIVDSSAIVAIVLESLDGGLAEAERGERGAVGRPNIAEAGSFDQEAGESLGLLLRLAGSQPDDHPSPISLARGGGHGSQAMLLAELAIVSRMCRC
jgi:hypothetical protein